MPLDQEFEVADPKKEKEMSFLDHVEELRWHILRSLIALLITSTVVFIFKGFVFDTLIFGPSRADFITFEWLCNLATKLGSGVEYLCVEEVGYTIVNLDISGQFLVHIKTAFMLGFVLAFPYILWEVWRFVKPGLYKREARASQLMLSAGSLLFFTGVVFGYIVLVPISLNFFGSYSIADDLTNTFSLNSYISFLSTLVLASGLMFELPMLVYILSVLGLIGPKDMRAYRRHAVVVILVVSALVTPADVFSQFLVAVPVYGLYEISIFISAVVQRDKRKREVEEEQAYHEQQTND